MHTGISRRTSTSFSVPGVTQWKQDPGSSPVQADGRNPIASLGAGFYTRFC